MTGAAAVLVGGAAAGGLAKSSQSFFGNKPPPESDRFRGGLPRACRDQSGRFLNPWLTNEGKDPCAKSAVEVFRLILHWRGGLAMRDAERSMSNAPTDLREPQAVDWEMLRQAHADPQSPAVVVWLGHACVLSVCRGRVVLFDPVFSERASPFAWVGPRRMVPSPVNATLADWPEDLGPDLIAVSHAHYDHLDDATVRTLRNRFSSARWAAPLGLGSWFSDRGIKLDAEMDWWQEEPNLLGQNLSLICLPAQHWSNRWPWDRNKTLWCSYGIAEDLPRSSEGGLKDMPARPARRKMHVMFAGDTGYCPVFTQIGSMFDISLAAVPIGAYEPEWFMAGQHCDPAGAVRITSDLGAAKALAIHWGTYPLTAETPRRQLTDLRAATGQDSRLQAVRIGDAISADSSPGANKSAESFATSIEAV